MAPALVLQRPSITERLILMFHGVGATPQSLAPLGERLATQFANAAVISVQAPDKSDFGQGFQWFSVHGVTEENRLAKIQETMPRFTSTIQSWQQEFNVTAEQTVLIGFSQGAIMALSLTQTNQESLASQVISLSGRFAHTPTIAPTNTTIHFLHGDQDPVIAYQFAQQAYYALKDLGADTSFELIPDLVHSINQKQADLIVNYLQR
ncbi:MAG: esterase [Vibrio sp.]